MRQFIGRHAGTSCCTSASPGSPSSRRRWTSRPLRAWQPTWRARWIGCEVDGGFCATAAALSAAPRTRGTGTLGGSGGTGAASRGAAGLQQPRQAVASQALCWRHGAAGACCVALHAGARQLRASAWGSDGPVPVLSPLALRLSTCLRASPSVAISGAQTKCSTLQACLSTSLLHTLHGWGSTPSVL